MDEIIQRLEFAKKLTFLAREAILPYFRGSHGVTNKGIGEYDPVTLADCDCEKALRSAILQNFPNDGIIGEEFENNISNNDWTWVLDPIDGTRAFVAGTATWGVLISAYKNNEPKIGIIDQSFTGESWIGAPKIAYWQKDNQTQNLNTNKSARLENSVLATTDPFLFKGLEQIAFENLRTKAPITRYGLDCIAYGLLAGGTIGLVVETGLKQVDLGALIPIVENAGGIFTDWKGNKNPISGQVIAAANEEIHKQALEILSKAAQ